MGGGVYTVSLKWNIYTAVKTVCTCTIAVKQNVDYAHFESASGELQDVSE